MSSIISTTPYYTSNVTTALTFNLPSCDSVRPADKTKSSFTDTLCFASDSKRRLKSKFPPLLIISVYYRIYAEDGAIPSKTPVTPDDPFLGRIDAISVPPPHTTKAVKHSIAKVENIKNRASTSLFVTSYNQSPMGDDEKVTVLNDTGLGSTPQEPLALVAKMSGSERSALESERRDGLASAEDSEPDAIPQEIRYRTSMIQHSSFFLS